jgi:nitrile hydratase beta subunit
VGAAPPTAPSIAQAAAVSSVVIDGIHDMGGMHGFGPVVVPGCERVYEQPWEIRTFAMSTIVGIEGLGEGSGRAIREEMGPEHYLRASYYERWLWSTEERLLRKGTIAPGEVDSWVDRLLAGEQPPERLDPEQAERDRVAISVTSPLGETGETLFAPGDRVRVRRWRHAGHTRCPRYARGAEGEVTAVRGTDRLPDIGPYEGPFEPVYSVSFRSGDVFGETGEPGWTVRLDLTETYLERA